MGKIVYLDCFSGASGDMFLGALVEVGLPIDNLRTALGSLALDKDGWSIEAERVDRAGIAATKFRLHETGNVESAKPSNSDSVHGHHHDSSHGRSHCCLLVPIAYLHIRNRCESLSCLDYDPHEL